MKINRYDVIIIGTGIGGLVCGNYLAKAGKKVLMFEKNNFPGGCCSSFISDGFFFDTGAHLLNEMGPSGSFKNILQELGIYNKTDYIPLNPLAVFYLGADTFIFNNDYRKCIHNLKSKFPKEDFDSFFSLMNKDYISLYKILKNNTFQDILDEYFKNPLLKALFYTFVFPVATFPERLSAIYGLAFVRSKLLSGYFYPKGGMQSISGRLAYNMHKNNKEIIFNNAVNKILVKGKKVYGVIDSNNKKFYADIVVSNISPLNTFNMLTKATKLSSFEKKIVSKMDLTESAFVVHIGLKKKIDILSKQTLYFYSDTDISYHERNKMLFLSKSPSYKPLGFICMPISIFQEEEYLRQRHSLNLLMVMYYKPKGFWDKYKEKFANAMIDEMEHIIPGFKDNIIFKKITTPTSIETFTGNNRGAVGGWAMTPEQTGPKSFPYQASIKNLYFVGHWTYPGSGISSAAISGRNVAKLILR
jgi:phytoene dehydrogenase-like protein